MIFREIVEHTPRTLADFSPGERGTFAEVNILNKQGLSGIYDYDGEEKFYPRPYSGRLALELMIQRLDEPSKNCQFVEVLGHLGDLTAVRSYTEIYSNGAPGRSFRMNLASSTPAYRWYSPERSANQIALNRGTDVGFQEFFQVLKGTRLKRSFYREWQEAIHVKVPPRVLPDLLVMGYAREHELFNKALLLSFRPPDSSRRFVMRQTADHVRRIGDIKTKILNLNKVEGVSTEHLKAIHLYFGLIDGQQRSLVDTGKVLGMSEAAVREMIEEAILIIRGGDSPRAIDLPRE